LNVFLVLPLVIIPLILMVLLGARKLSIGNSTRTWGAIAFNFSITMPVVLTAEIILFILLVVLMIVWLNTQPLLLNQILSLSNLFSQENIDTQAAEAIFTNLFTHPIVLNISILVISLLVPLIEEFLKPMALWFLAGKKLTPAQGFIGGLIAGACFAAIETMGSIGAPVDNTWYMILFGRIGTGLLHITLSGLVGWGIASAFYNRNWGRAIFNYFGAVLIHGTWNLFALLSGILPILPAQEGFSPLLLVLSQIGPYLLVVIAVLNLFILIRANRRLQFETRQTSPLPAQS
ncbi:MAG TPA: PrsW family glutamic-type intramembrane protease, partial [Anaerovoracaceae bacterium]|nr:PrsW family glutamic-type intramembrane protease [Anaerovoracaceae bacterium]